MSAAGLHMPGFLPPGYGVSLIRPKLPAAGRSPSARKVQAGSGLKRPASAPEVMPCSMGPGHRVGAAGACLHVTEGGRGGGRFGGGRGLRRILAGSGAIRDDRRDGAGIGDRIGAGLFVGRHGRRMAMLTVQTGVIWNHPLWHIARHGRSPRG